ncbi:hypothetical protein BKA70DRAFT_1442056 [Coprinopsis sp. MPI-PUGE-AT-0042]|nr:hypothetical protein BKA70DRAFT_1442056 [Coprinopsis sp. MPI-PUGE-AT-0042]
MSSSQSAPRQQFDCLRVAAPFYREACKAGEMNWFLEDFLKSYFNRFPVPSDEFPTAKLRNAEKWRRETEIVRKLNWLRYVGLQVRLPTTWQKFVNLSPSTEYANLAHDILNQLDSSKATSGPSLRRVVISSDDEGKDTNIIESDSDEETRAPTYTGLDGASADETK